VSSWAAIALHYMGFILFLPPTSDRLTLLIVRVLLFSTPA